MNKNARTTDHNMYRIILLILQAVLASLPLCVQAQSLDEHLIPLPSRICFGSCGHQDKPQPILQLAAAHRPDLFVFLGDNIYGDTDNMKVLEKKYAKWAACKDFQILRQQCPLIATWDDHDFGQNDAGRHYPHKEASKRLFLDFFQVPENDPRRGRAGIYTSYVGEGGGRRVQLILLDLRTFRDDLLSYEGQPVDRSAYTYKLDYWPYDTQDSTLLGEEQWAWLDRQLQQPADLRIVASSTQFGITWNGYEAWANFPHEQKRFFELVKKNRANGVLFLSGDVHYAEISRMEVPGIYPLYDVTASGITSTWGFATPNLYRLEGPVMENHFGQLDVDWSEADPLLTMSIFDVKGKLRVAKKIRLSELSLR